MTVARLRTRMRRLAHNARDEEESGEGGELNLVPFLDIVTNVLLFLFATVSFTAAVSELPARLRAEATTGGAPSFVLGLHLSEGSITVLGDAGLAPGGAPVTLPAIGGEPDYPGLTRVARELKAAHPEARTVQVSAQSGVPYERVIGALDAVRGTAATPLFPEPLLVVAGE